MNCRHGPKLQKVIGKEELCAVPLKEGSKISAKKLEDMGSMAIDLIKNSGPALMWTERLSFVL